MNTYLRLIKNRQHLIELLEETNDKDECSYYLMVINHINNKLTRLQMDSMSDIEWRLQ